MQIVGYILTIRYILLWKLQIGNAVINPETDGIGMYDYLGSHAIISDVLVHKVRTHCNFSFNATPQSDECNEAVDEVRKDTHHIDIYNIYAPSCFHKSTTAKPKKPSVSNYENISSLH
jgi:serine carboxypeptidase-like clade 2